MVDHVSFAFTPDIMNAIQEPLEDGSGGISFDVGDSRFFKSIITITSRYPSLTEALLCEDLYQKV